jgi:hypothetical protein
VGKFGEIFRALLAAAPIAIGLGVLSGGAQAAEAGRCTLAQIAASYKEGLSRLDAGDPARALIVFAPLADAGLGPAQRQIANMYAAGQGVAKSLPDAALWSELAFRSGDENARRHANQYRAELDAAGRGALDQRLAVWRAGGLVCDGGRIRFDPKAADAPLEFHIEFQRRVSDEDQATARRILPGIIQSALEQDPMARIYLSAIETFEFHTGGQYHRYIGWAPRKPGMLRIATNVSMDDSPQYAAKAVLLEAKRKVYESLPDSPFLDPYMRVMNGMKVYGSVYPDVNNGTYFRLMRQAFDMAEKLPPEVRKYVEIVNEIQYGPISKHYKPEGSIDAQGAYYNKVLSEPGHRIIFARRNMLYSSPLYLLQTLVHEGTHAAQDEKAYRALVEVEKLKKQPGSEQKISQLMDYPRRWYRGIEGPGGKRIQDIAFECEATQSEIIAIKAVGGSPDVMDASGYIKLCPEQQKLLVRWRDEIGKPAKGAKGK